MQINFLEWIDLIWIPVSLAIVSGSNRVIALMFVVFCSFSLRIQEELLEALGISEHGITGWLDSDPYIRGLICYTVATSLFMVLSIYSKGTHGYVYMAASISIFVVSFLISLLVMAI